MEHYVKVPLFIIAHSVFTLCASRDSTGNSGFLRSSKYKDIFARIMTVQEKDILARAIGIQRENCG